MPTRVAQIGSALFYAASSLLIVIANKVLLTSYKFPSPNFLAFSQFIATCAILWTLKIFKYIDFPDMQWSIPKKIFPLPLIFFANVATGLGATKAISLPMFTALRRFSILMTMLLEIRLLGSKPSLPVKTSVAAMIIGALIAASNDLSFELYGYVQIFLNDAFTACFGVILKQKLDAKNLNDFGVLFYNSLLSAPLVLALMVYTDEFTVLQEYKGYELDGFWMSFVLSTVMGACLNYSIFLCTQHNSALTTTVVGCLKNIITAYVGFVVGGDYVFSIVNFIGLNLSMAGSVWYAYVQFVEKKPSPAPANTAPNSNSPLAAGTDAKKEDRIG